MHHNTQHIGIVGCSAEGAALCYKTICTESPKMLGEHAHPEISMHTMSLSDYVECLHNDDINGIATLMLDSAKKLKAQGADFLICPDNTIHQAFDIVIEQSPLPWIHIADAVVAEAKKHGYVRLGLLGTKWLVNSRVYPERIEKAGLYWQKPEFDEIQEINRIIMKELVMGNFSSETTAYLQDVIETLKNEECDAVVLGCTELPLVIRDENSALPVLDSNRLLALAAIEKATNN